MRPEENPEKEGHTREWQDRARVVIDAKEAAKTEASPKQSPLPDEGDKANVRSHDDEQSEDDDSRDVVY